MLEEDGGVLKARHPEFECAKTESKRISKKHGSN